MIRCDINHRTSHACFPKLLCSTFLTQLQESGLKLAEVFKFDSNTEPWKNLDDDNRFSDFHAVVWGKRMDDEEREWHNLQSESHITVDDDVIMGDDEDREDTDGELIPGCYELGIGAVPTRNRSYGTMDSRVIFLSKMA